MNVNTLENQENHKIIAGQDHENEILSIPDLFEAFLDNTVFGIAVINKNHKIIRVNSTFVKYFNKNVEDFVGKYCYKECEKRNHICPHCPGVKAIASGKTEKVETHGIQEDGSPFYIRICAIPFYNSNNEIAGFIEMVENTTEYKKEKEALLQSEERFKQVAENAGDWIWEMDAEGLYTYSSPIVEQILGYKPEEIVGKKHFYDFFTPECKEELKKGAFEVFNKKECFKSFINPNIHKNGDIVILETCGSPLINNKGNLCGYRGIDRDITERKKWEKQLQQTQEELIEASRRAGMSEVAADILHNVGNVLNSINVTTTLIKKTLSNSEIPNLKIVTDMLQGQLGNLDKFLSDDPKGKHIPSYLNEVVKHLTYEQEEIIGKLKTLIEDINHIKTIIYMQQEYTKVSGSEVAIKIDQVIENSIRINQASLKKHGIQIIKEFIDLGEVHVSKNGVMQILVNLIANAKNALLESNISNKILTIRTYVHNNHYLRIEVKDNGTGISIENLSKLFQHGFTTRKDGHGFGLHSSAIAAKEMKGSLTAYSKGLGHGATFTLELPLKLANSCQVDDKPSMIS